MRIIETEDDIAEGVAHLAAAEPRFAAVLPQLAPLPLRRSPEGFEQLLWAIVGQQLSIASAAAIRARLAEAGLTAPQPILAAPDQLLRAAGLSGPKIRYVRALAAAPPDFGALRHMPEAEAVGALTTLPGIGVWTAEIYLMFSLGRADVFCAGDLALQESARMLYGLPARPSERALRAMAAEWAPWRAVAARALWAYYRHAKGREGVT
jgi:DNA-3-methyladenine glycosylase II